jgi:hypothetical protein
MRGWKSTLALVVVLGGLLGYIYFVDRERPEPGTEVREKPFEVSPENIIEVALRNAAGETARVQRIDTAWQLLEPEKSEADATEVASMTSSLASLEVQRVVDENPADLAQYGLNPPRIEVAFRANGETEFDRLLIGDKTPTGNELYAKTPDQSRVFLISGFLDTTFSKTAFDLRNKAVLKFARDQADTIDVRTGGGTLRLVRKGTEWRLDAPVAARADYAAVEGLLSRLDGARMQRIVTESAEDLRPYGLTSPVITAAIATGSSRATLLIGVPDANGLRFAKDDARPTVFTVEQTLVTDLQKSADEYRRKDLFDARAFTTTRLEVLRNGAARVFEKSKGANDADVWRDATGKELDSTKVEDLLGQLTGLRATTFEVTRPPSLTSPVLTATIRFDDRTETVTFGREGSTVFASRGDEPGAARLEAAPFDGVLTALDGVQ